MPQIFPMNWFMISMILLLTLIMINSHIFFFDAKKMKFKDKNNIDKSNKNFKW